MSDAWYNPKCPLCDTVNWYAERTDDITCNVAEAVRCWKCEVKFFIDEETTRDSLGWRVGSDPDAEYSTVYDYLKDASWCWGRSNPTDPYRSIFE